MAQARDEAGNIWEVDAQGNAVRLIQAANSAPQMPADPTYQYQGAKAGADLANAQANATGQVYDNQVAAQTVGANVTKTQADAVSAQRTAQTAGLPEGFMWDRSGSNAIPIPGYTRQGLSPEIRKQAIDGLSDAQALERTAAQLEKLYQQGPGATHGPMGLADYLPTAANGVFNDAGQQARGYIKRALGFTGGEGNTVAESSALYDPYLPSTWDKDARIEQKIAAMRQLAQDARAKAAATLGGLPDASGNIVPVGGPMGNPTPWDRNPSQFDVAASGATQTIRDPKLNAQIDAMINAGASEAQINAVLAEHGIAPVDGQKLQAARNWLQNESKGQDYTGSDFTREQPLPLFSQFIGSGFGTGLTAAANASAGGIPQMLAGQQGDANIAAMEAMNPGWAMAGNMLGAIGGTSLIEKAGAKAVGASAPRAGAYARALLGKRGSEFARNAAVDTAYGALYGGTTEGDPLGGALSGALGSVGGQALGGTVGKALGGIPVSAAVKALGDRGIPMTVGQKLGGTAARIEDKAMSIPLVGDMIRNRRMEGIEAFNREAFKDAGAPIGAVPQEIGQEGIQQLYDAASQSYDDATRGVVAPFDQQFMGDMQRVYNSARRMPADRRHALGEIMDARIAHIADTGQMTGEQFQQAMRALKGNRSKVPGQFDGFEQEYRDAITGTMDALKGTMQRGGGQRTVDGLAAADEAYRASKTLERAANSAAGGSQTDELFMFTPSQLQRAGMASAAKYPGPRPFADLADAGQAVLPSRIPNSGTADRAAQMVLPGAGAAALGGGAGYLAGGEEGAKSSAVLAALALMGGTKAGQKAIGKALFDRPNGLRQIGEAVSKRKGLFGSAAIPLAFAAN